MRIKTKLSALVAFVGVFYCCIAIAPIADAAIFVTELADFEMQDPDDGPPLTGIRRVDASGGHVFTNQFDSPNGPFGLGAEIRTVIATQLSTALDGEAFQPLEDSRAGFEGNDLIMLGAIRGSITAAAAGAATATFTSGRAYIVSIAQGTFDPRNPDTWNFAAGTFVEFGLKPPEPVVPGAGGGLAFPADVINQSSVNTTSSNQAQGRFLVREDSTAAQNAIPGSGDDWMTVTTNTTGFPVIDEGLFIQSGQTTEFDDFEELSGPALGASDLLVLNAIFADMSTKAGLGALSFATAFGAGADSNWNPQFSPPAGDGPTGDFRGELQLRNAPGNQVIPEPGSIVVHGLLIASVAFLHIVRRRNRAAQTL